MGKLNTTKLISHFVVHIPRLRIMTREKKEFKRKFQTTYNNKNRGERAYRTYKIQETRTWTARRRRRIFISLLLRVHSLSSATLRAIMDEQSMMPKVVQGQAGLRKSFLAGVAIVNSTSVMTVVHQISSLTLPLWASCCSPGNFFSFQFVSL